MRVPTHREIGRLGACVMTRKATCIDPALSFQRVIQASQLYSSREFHTRGCHTCQLTLLIGNHRLVTF